MINSPTSSLADIGLRTLADAQKKAGDRQHLGQEDFLKLMVTQLRNQDPLQPMENGKFLTQIAQFSQVSGLADLQKSFKDLSHSLVSNQALQAAALVGRRVLVPTATGDLTKGGQLQGQLDLPQATGSVRIRVQDEHGQTVRQFDLGPQPSGPVPFHWDGHKDDGSAAAPGTYHVVAEALVDGKREAVDVALANRVRAVTLGQGGGLSLDVAGVGTMAFSDIKQIL